MSTGFTDLEAQRREVHIRVLRAHENVRRWESDLDLARNQRFNDISRKNLRRLLLAAKSELQEAQGELDAVETLIRLDPDREPHPGR